MTTITKACGYVRFSSAIQERGTSTFRQRRLIDDWIKQHPEVTLLNVYTDLGKSAWNVNKQDERKAFLQMVDDRQSDRLPEPIYLLCEDASRLSRLDYDEAIDQMKKLISMGFVIILLASGKRYDAESFKRLGDRITFMVDAMAHNEQSEQKSHHSRKNWKQKRERAILTGELISKSCARWCTPVATGTGEPAANGRKTTFIFNEHMPTVKRIFEMRLAGLSMGDIANMLNLEGVPTLTGKVNAWNQTTIHGILNNRAVLGEYHPSRRTVVGDADPIPNYYPTIPGLTEGDFMTAQSMREGKGRTSNSDNPTNINMFKGVLKCACGGAIISASVTPERYGYYTCSMYRLDRCTVNKYSDDKGKNKGVAISRQLVDEHLLHGLLYNIPKLLSGSNSDQKILSNLEAEHKQIETTLENLENNMLTMTMTDRLQKLYEAQALALEAKQKQIDEHRSRMITAVNIETIEDIDTLTREGRTEINLIAKKYIKEIRLNLKRKTCDIELNNGFKFFDYPLWRDDFDGASWVSFFLALNEKEYTFTGTEDISANFPGSIDGLPTEQAKPGGETSEPFDFTGWPEPDE